MIYVQNEKGVPMKYDYVIVGGGSGGSTLAARLSEDPNTTVCLLEAGGKGVMNVYDVPGGNGHLVHLIQPLWGDAANTYMNKVAP